MGGARPGMEWHGRVLVGQLTQWRLRVDRDRIGWSMIGDHYPPTDCADCDGRGFTCALDDPGLTVRMVIEGQPRQWITDPEPEKPTDTLTDTEARQK